MVEIWKDIPEYEGYYQVSNFGRIKALSRIVKNGKNTTYLKKESFVSTKSQVNGYFNVRLWKDGKTKLMLLHRVIFSAFNNIDIHELDVDHIDNNRENNRLNNLRSCTRSQNLANKSVVKGKSKYKGVTYDKKNNMWRCQIKKGEQHIKCKRTKTEEESAILYDKLAIELFGEYAKTNKMLGLLDY